MGDLIIRDAVLKILNNSRGIRARDGAGGVWINLMDAIGEIERVPAVEAKPVRHGEWINAGHDAFTQYRRCSSCAGILANAPAYDYCPRCGAKMKEG